MTPRNHNMTTPITTPMTTPMTTLMTGSPSRVDIVL